MTTAEITLRPDGTVASYNGFDAVSLFRVKTIIMGIKMHRDHGMILTRGATITKLFKMSEEYTGQKYKRGEHNRAIADLQNWHSIMLSAMPITQQED